MNKTKTSELKPFLKWAGNKRKLVPEIQKYFPKRINRYYEPFLGAGAVFLATEAQEYFLNDINCDLITCWRSLPIDKLELIDFNSLFTPMRRSHSKDFYYKVRDQYRDVDSFHALSLRKQMAIFIYLNKGCFNGLCRYNQHGKFNTPWNRQDGNINIDLNNLLEVGKHINSLKILFQHRDFNDFFSFLAKATNSDWDKSTWYPTSGDVVYLDPPYVPVSSTANFTEYFGETFDHTKQRELAHHAIACVKNGAKVVASNSDTEFARSLYTEKYFDIHEIKVARAINSKGDRRQPVTELLIVSK